MFRSAGVLFISKKTKRALFGLRGKNSSFSFTWDLFGGKLKITEDILTGLGRELGEELGFDEIYIETLIPINISENKKYKYYSFLAIIENEFLPDLNTEHEGFCWINIENWKSIRLHPKVKEFLDNPKLIEHIKKLVY